MHNGIKSYIILTLAFVFLLNCHISEGGFLRLWTPTWENEMFSELDRCQNLLPYFPKKNIESASTDQCVLLFSEEACRGNSYRLLPGNHLNLLGFNDRAVSFQSCSSNGLSTDPEVAFYTNTNFTHWPLSYERIPSSCKNIHWRYADSGIFSIKTKKCVVLFREENCYGQRYQVPRGEHSNLGAFNDKAKSFRSCTRNADEEEYHLKFYKNANFTGIVDDVELQPDCTENIYLDLAVKSIETPVCVRLFGDYKCQDRTNFEIRRGRHSSHSVLSIKTKIKSVKPCNEADVRKRQVSTTQTPSLGFGPSTSSGDFKLSAKITKIEVSTDREEVEKGASHKLHPVRQRALFGNDRQEVGLGKLLVEQDIPDNFFLEKISTFSGISEWEFPLKIDFTPEFTSLLDSRFRHPLQRDVQLATGNKVDVGFLNPSKGSPYWEEFSNESEAFQAGKELLHLKILQSLISSYQQNKTFPSGGEETKEIKINNKILVPACTEYEVTSFFKQTEDLLMTYTFSIEVTGMYSDGVEMSAEEVKQKLEGVNFQGKKDDFTVLAQGNAQIISDFLWYFVWNGRGTPIQRCQNEATSPSIGKGSIAFYDNSYFKDLLFQTKLTGSCQLLNYQSRNKIESVKTEACVILFPTETCDIIDEKNLNVGYTLKILPNEGRTLPYFANVTKAFQLCESYKGGSSRVGHAQFYSESSEENYEPLADARLTADCTNLPDSAKRNVSSVGSNHCAILYSEPECSGRNFTVRPFSGMKLRNHFDKLTASFKACPDLPENVLEMEGGGRIKFYEGENRTQLLLDSPLGKSCINLRERDWSKVRSLQSESCVVLYDHPFCQGTSVSFQPGSGDVENDFKNEIKSFVACDEVETVDVNTEGIDEGLQSCDSEKNDITRLNTMLREICQSTRHHLCRDFNNGAASSRNY